MYLNRFFGRVAAAQMETLDGALKHTVRDMGRNGTNGNSYTVAGNIAEKGRAMVFVRNNLRKDFCGIVDIHLTRMKWYQGMAMAVKINGDDHNVFHLCRAEDRALLQDRIAIIAQKKIDAYDLRKEKTRIAVARVLGKGPL